MLSTLLQIPHDVAGLPIFGFGWALGAWLITGIGFIAWLIKRQGWNDDTRSYLPMFLMVAVAIAFVLPWIEEKDPATGLSAGLPIRGYGVMVMLGVVSGVSLAAWQAKRVGLDPEHIFTLAFWLFVAGIVGARGFYVVQNWSQFQRPSLGETISEVMKFTQGGLVVYGSFIGATLALVVYCRREKLPLLAIADLITPSMLLGLSLGRIGCFLNGCCFGGLCALPLGVSFPETSPPFQHQLATGLFYGVRVDWDDATNQPFIAKVEPDSAASKAGVTVGTVIRSVNGFPANAWPNAFAQIAETGGRITLESDGGKKFEWQASAVPRRSLPVHPVQLYAAVEAGLLSLVLWSYFPFRRRDGELFALLLLIHPIARFLQEMIRDDLPGALGTPLTISQLLSVLMFVVGAAAWIALARRPRGVHFQA